MLTVTSFVNVTFFTKMLPELFNILLNGGIADVCLGDSPKINLDNLNKLIIVID